MARYTQDSIERLRESADIVALISRKTDLRRVGSRWTGLCPFHEERTPSFSVDPERGLYHCFGCGVGGDAIRLRDGDRAAGLPAARSSSWPRTTTWSSSASARIPRRSSAASAASGCWACSSAPPRFYATVLRDSAEAGRARDYLRERGLSEQVLADFRVGYAPKAWDRLLTGARRAGLHRGRAAGRRAVHPRARTAACYDRFRERITFPLADARGRVLGFGARAMRDDQGAKYINTAEGELYHKGRQLFGIDRARAAVAKAQRVIVVEGYTDVLALHDAGMTETVGVMGTALTKDQMAELARRRWAPRARSTWPWTPTARARRPCCGPPAWREDRAVSLRVVRLPEGQDPADLVTGRGAGRR